MHRYHSRVPKKDQPVEKRASLHRGALLAIVAAIVLGIAARGIAIANAPQNSYLADHLDNMAWSSFACENGPQNIYDFDPKSGIVVRYRDPRRNEFMNVAFPVPHACNYPPASAYVFWLQGALWHALDGQIVTVRVLPQFRNAIAGESVSSRVIDTPVARFVQAFPSVMFDFLLAWGVAALVVALRGGRSASIRAIAGDWASVGAFATVLLAPPVFLDSAFWGQTDSWISALLVWTLWAVLTVRWLSGGVLFGLACVIKPQAILFGPVLFFIVLALRFGSGGSWRNLVQAGKFAGAAAAAVCIVTIPFMLADAGHADGPLRWFQRSYVATIGAESYQRITLNAFNLWWLVWMSQGATVESLSSSVQSSVGVTRQMLGKLLLAVGVLLTGALAAWRMRWSPESWIATAYGVCLCAFALPTGVHERYIFYCIPFLIALVCVRWKCWLLPLVLLLIVGTFEMVSFRWVKLDDASVRGQTTVLAVMTLVALVYSWAAIAFGSSRTSKS